MSGVTISRRAVAMWQCPCPFPCWKSRGYRADGVLLNSSATVHEDLCLSETLKGQNENALPLIGRAFSS